MLLLKGEKWAINISLKLSKLFLALLILYASYFQEVFFKIPNAISILGFLVVFFLLVVIFINSTPISNGISIEIVLWAVFAASSLFIGYVISKDPVFTIASVFTFIQNLILIIALCFICKYDGNIDYINKILITLAFLCAITTIFWGQVYLGSNQISLTANTNPNKLGLILVTGVFCLLYKLDLNKKLSIIMVAAGSLFFLYTIILTASRKSLLAAGLIFVWWLLFSFSAAFKKITVSRKMGAAIALILTAICILNFIVPVFENSLMLQRLTNFFVEGGNLKRIRMYHEAYEFFLSSPLFGIGYNNYRLLSVYGTYSHSIYAEALACTGMLGVVFYFGAYLTMAVKTIRIIFNKYLNYNVRIQARTILGIFLVMVFLGTGVIHFYELNSCIVFAMIISFDKLYYKPQRKLVLNE